MISIIKKCIPFIFMVLTNHVPWVKCQYICENNGNYTANSTYRANLKTLLSSLHSNVPECGFYNASAGQSPDIVNAIVLCRGDVELKTCRRCVYNNTIDIVNFCPHAKQAYLWRELCMLHYSNEPILGTLANYPESCTCNATGRDDDFKVDLRALFRLGLQAASRPSLKKIAAGKLTLPEDQTIYALVQCTPDLSQPDCNTCLRNAVQDIPRCCNGTTGAVAIFRPSCTLRYETFEFYNPTTLQGSFSPLPPGKDKNDSTKIVIIIVVPVAGCLILAFVTCTFLRRRMKQKPKQNLEIITGEWLQYHFSIIRDATNDFSEANKLGQGGFGAVYKGELVSGQEIAVKRLSKSSEQGDQEFKNEASLLARLQHRNLVRLLGFCLTQTERILVYEFVQNASLDHFIFGCAQNENPDPIRRQKMGWDIRHKIIRGIAKGLVYLHEDSRLTIIHRDLKVSNVLLDGDMNPKIADFGMARLVVQDETHGRTDRIVGTRGYMSPEYAYNGYFSVKSDVFSFGVIVLEIVSGQKNNNFRDEDQNKGHLLSYAWRNWHEGNAENVVDPALRDSSGFRDDILRCVHIGLLCVQENAADRPTMASVILMLNSSSLSLSVPSKPGFFLPERLGRDIENPGEMKPNNESGQPTLSRNGISMTEMCPR